MLKKWIILSTCAVAAAVVIIACTELAQDSEEKEEL